MKKLSVLFVVLLISCSASYGAPSLIIRNASDSSTPATPTWVVEEPYISGDAPISSLPIGAASKTFTISPNEKKDFGLQVPDGATGFTFDVFGGGIRIGDSTDIATDSGFLVASGTIGAKWDKEKAGRFKLYATPDGAATVTVKLGVAYGRRKS